MNLIKSFSKLDLSETVTVDEDGNVSSTGLVNLFDEKHVSALLCNYAKIKEDSWSDFNGDAKWLMMDLDTAVDNALKDKFPLYYDLVIYKIDGKQNQEIQDFCVVYSNNEANKLLKDFSEKELYFSYSIKTYCNILMFLV